MNITTRPSAITQNNLTLSDIKTIETMLHAMLVKYLADTWVLTGEAVKFPLDDEQQTRLLESLDVCDLSRLDGFLTAIADLTRDDMNCADIEREICSFWLTVSRFQILVSWTQTRKMSINVQEGMQTMRNHQGLAA